MRILICTGIYPPDIGGPATYSKLINDELPKHGIDVDILSFGEVRKLPKVIRHFVYFCKVLMMARKVNVIFAQDTISVGFPAMLGSKILRKIFMIRVPGDYVWEQATQRFGVTDSIDDFQNNKYSIKIEFLRLIQKFVCNQAEVIVTPSIYFKDLVSGWVKNKQKIRVIYNGIELSKMASSTERQKIILSAGRLVPWKGFDLLIEIMKDLPGWKLIIAGDGPERDRLQAVISNLGLDTYIEITGAVSKMKMMDLLDQCDIFILNTSFESFSFQIVEAMNAGIPIITTNIGSLPELITDGKEGILVEPNNKKQILAAIGLITQNKRFREEIIKNAQIKSQKFSIEETLNGLIKLLNTL